MPAGCPDLLHCIPFAGFLDSSCFLKSLLLFRFASAAVSTPNIWISKNKGECLGVKIKLWNKYIINLNWIVKNITLLYLLSQSHDITKENTTDCSCLRFILWSFFPYSEIYIYLFLWLSQDLLSAFKNLLNTVLEWHWSVLLSQPCIIHNPGIHLLNSSGKFSFWRLMIPSTQAQVTVKLGIFR